MSKKRGRRGGAPAVWTPRPRASHEDVLAANGIIAVRWAMEFRCNRVRTVGSYLFYHHLSRARVA